MTNASRITDRHAVVTGASSGIGRATALALSAAGARVSLVARRRERLEEVASEIQSAGGEASVIAADLARPGEAQRAAEEAIGKFGAAGVLVNSAGGAVGGSVWGVGDAPQARAMFEIDFWSPLALIHAVLPAMRRSCGTVVNVTSISQLATWPMFGYSAAVK